MSLIGLVNYYFKIRRIRRSVVQKGGRISSKVKLSVSGDLQIGNDVILNSQGIDLTEKCHIAVYKGGVMSIGDHSGISQSSIHCKNRITIGENVNIGAGCLIIDSDFHNTDWQTRTNRVTDTQTAPSAPINIEDNVFIGARTIVLKGVTIGARSVIAAGSVVVSDIPADCLAGGNPCKVIKNI